MHDLTYVWRDGMASWTVLHLAPLEYVTAQFTKGPSPPRLPPKMLALPPPPPVPDPTRASPVRRHSSMDVGDRLSAVV